MEYRKIVLEHFGSTVDYEYQTFSKSYEVEYNALETSDGYNIYRRYTGPGSIAWDADIFYYADNMVDLIKEDIRDGLNIFIDEDIAHECGFEEDGDAWQDIFDVYIYRDDD